MGPAGELQRYVLYTSKA